MADLRGCLDALMSLVDCSLFIGLTTEVAEMR